MVGAAAVMAVRAVGAVGAVVAAADDAKVKVPPGDGGGEMGCAAVVVGARAGVRGGVAAAGTVARCS
jgi:hypothetical protein